MTGLNRAYLNAMINAMVLVNRYMGDALITELLANYSDYGKDDTLMLDALPENILVQMIYNFDPNIVVLGEERNYPIPPLPREIDFYPPFLIMDSLDGSGWLVKILETAKEGTFEQIRNDPEKLKEWENLLGPPIRIIAPVCSATLLMHGRIVGTVILNLLTQELFLSCNKGTWSINVSNLAILDLEEIFLKGERVSFSGYQSIDDLDRQKGYITFFKKGYDENLKTIPVLERAKLIEGDFAGNLRILHLADFYPNQPGFILSNGEKITETIHWFAFAMNAGLHIYEVFVAQPLVRGGVLMSPGPAYSIFKDEGKETIIEMGKIESFPNPAKYRMTVIITGADNEHVITRMNINNCRRLNFKFEQA